MDDFGAASCESWIRYEYKNANYVRITTIFDHLLYQEKWNEKHLDETRLLFILQNSFMECFLLERMNFEGEMK